MDITEFIRDQNIKRHPWEKTRAKIIEFLITKYSSSCTHMLDVGSGDAFVLKELCKHHISIYYTAIDTAYTEDIINTLRSKDNCDITFLKTLPEILYPKADCVLILDVLEHCENDGEVLKKLNSYKELNSPTFFITVPAFQALFSKHDKLLNHHRRYTVYQLETLCKKQNFEIIDSGYFFSSLIILRIIQLFLEKLNLRNSTKSVDNWRGNKKITRLISGLLWIDFVIENNLKKIGIRLPGLSAYCVCRPLLS